MTQTANERAKTPLPIYSDVEINDLPDPDYLLEGLVQERSVAPLYGPTGEAKTFVEVDVAFCIGTGTPFHGREVLQGNVVYVYAEGASNAKHRAAAWKGEHGLSPNDQCNVWFIPTAVDLLSSDGVEELLQTIRLTVPEPVRLVVIDTLARCFGDGDEDRTHDMNRFTNRCHAIKEALDCTVMPLHHTGWENKRERGNKSLRNNSDTFIRCSMSNDIVTLACEKQKDALEFEPIRLRLTEVQLGDGATSCVLRGLDGDQSPRHADLKPEHRRVLSILVDLGDSGAPYSAWLTAAEEAEVSESSFKRTRKELVVSGYVHGPPADESKGFKYTLTNEGRCALGHPERVQGRVNPSTSTDGAEDPMGPNRVHPQAVDQTPDTNGARTGSNRSMSPNARMGSRGGAYRAPLEPNQKACIWCGEDHSPGGYCEIREALAS